MAGSINWVQTRSAVNMAFSAFVKTVQRYQVTAQKSNSTGQISFIAQAPSQISAVFFRREDVIKQEQLAMLRDADAVIIVQNDVVIRQHEFIKFDGETFQIKDKPLKRYLGTEVIYIVAHLYRYGEDISYG